MLQKTMMIQTETNHKYSNLNCEEREDFKLIAQKNDNINETYKSFKTQNELKKSKKISRIKEGLSLIQSGKTVIDINNNSIVIVKDERK